MANHLHRVELHAIGHVDIASLTDLFPALTIERVGRPSARAITAECWRSEELDFWAFDRAADQLASSGTAIEISGDHALVQEVLTRIQRLAPYRNAASSTPWFDRVLTEHAALHDLTRPLVQADLDHALDAWQWVLRLDPSASADVQLATLLHDVERLVTEPDQRIEHHALDYQAFKDAHAMAGARLARDTFERAGVPESIAATAAGLIAVHERTGDADPNRTINDADALSFFSLNCPGYLAYFGPEQTARKVDYTLARMSARARRELEGVRLPRAVRDQLKRSS